MRWHVWDQQMVFLALALVAQSLVRRGARWLSEARAEARLGRRGGLVALVVAALLVVAPAARLAVPPALLHSNFHAMRLLESVLAFPAPVTHRASYGHGAFVVLGAICAAVGRSVENVVRANAVIQTATLGLAAMLVARSGGAWAAVGTLAAGALSPLMLRVAASEDAHNVAVCAGMLAFLWFDSWRRRPGDISDALGIVGACVLCADSRQSMVLWVATIVLLSALRRGAWAALALGALMLVPGTIVRVQSLSDRSSYFGYAAGLLVCQGPAFWANHPLIGEPGSWPLALLGGLGVVVAWRRRAPTLAAAGVTAVAQLVMTFAVACAPMPREAAYQRLAPFALLTLLAGYGLSTIASSPARGARALATVAAAALLVAGVPGFARLVRSVEPFYAEMAVARSRLAGRGPVTLVVPRFDGREPPNTLSAVVLQNPSVRVVTADSPEARRPGALRFESISCYAFNLAPCIEDGLSSGTAEDLASLLRLRRAVVRGLADPTEFMRGVHCPVLREARPECGAAFRRGRFVPWATIDVPQDQVPVVYFSASRVTVGVWTDEGASTP